jgi:hypothetical protein
MAPGAARSISRRPTSREHRKAPVALVSITLCHASSGISAAGAPQEVPALLTRMSTSPSSTSASSSAARTSSSEVTSSRSAIVRTPWVSASSRATSSHASRLRDASATDAPACASPGRDLLAQPAPAARDQRHAPAKVEQLG